MLELLLLAFLWGGEPHTITFDEVNGATHYIVHWRRGEAPTLESRRRKCMESPCTFKLPKIAPGKVIYLKIAAVNEAGEGPL